MLFNPFTWGIGYASKRVADKAIDTFAEDELTRNLKKEAKDWGKDLPEEIKIEPEVFFFIQRTDKIDPGNFPQRVQLTQYLEVQEIPPKELWFKALQEYREDRRTVLKDEAHIFFRKDNASTDPYLEDLADRFYNTCIQTPSFFRKTVITTLESIKNIQGVDERDLAVWLEKLESETKPDRLKEVQKWYDDRDILGNLRDALIIVIERMDQDSKISLEKIDRLKAEGNYQLAELLEPLNQAFEKGLDSFEKEEAKVLQQIEKKEAKNKIAVFIASAEKFEAALQFKKAIQRLESALKLEKEYFNKDGKRVSDILNQLGILYDTIGHYDSAITYYDKALASDLNTYGPDHPAVARSWNNLGSAWKSKGEYDKAIGYYDKALASGLKTYGPDHPAVATHWNNLGLAWNSKGEYDKAIAYYDKALASGLKTFGPDHPAVATRWNNLGGAWNSKGEYDKAIEYYDKALASDLNTFGPDHPAVATTWNNLGFAWNSKGEYDKAIEYYGKALASDLTTFGSDHPAVATRWNNLGLAWNSKGEYDKAIEYYGKALAVCEKILGKDHPNTKIVKSNLNSARNERK